MRLQIYVLKFIYKNDKCDVVIDKIYEGMVGAGGSFDA